MPGKVKDITGKTFGRLTVMWPAAYGKHNQVYWLCCCSCGNYTTTRTGSLNAGVSRSCGCINKEFMSAGIRRTHGASGTPEYSSYKHAKERCNNPNHEAWSRYGGRGIKFLFTSFEQFLAEVGKKPSPSHSIDRIRNNSHYMPGNVRWATRSEQAQNCCHWDAIKK